MPILLECQKIGYKHYLAEHNSDLSEPHCCSQQLWSLSSPRAQGVTSQTTHYSQSEKLPLSLFSLQTPLPNKRAWAYMYLKEQTVNREMLLLCLLLRDSWFCSWGDRTSRQTPSYLLSQVLFLSFLDSHWLITNARKDKTTDYLFQRGKSSLPF